jgi:hypothetical protein
LFCVYCPFKSLQDTFFLRPKRFDRDAVGLLSAKRGDEALEFGRLQDVIAEY